MTDCNNEWLREQIAFAIWNSANPPHIREHLTPTQFQASVTTAIGGGWTATSDLGLDWSLNRESFLQLADVAIRAFEAADADGSAYEAKPEATP